MTIRVTHLIYGLALGGLEQMVVQLSARAKKRGIDSSILALAFDGPVRQMANDNGIAVELLPQDGLSVGALLGIRKELEKRESQIVHAHDLGPWLNAVAVRAMRPRISTIHGTDSRLVCGEGTVRPPGSQPPPRSKSIPPSSSWVSV